MAQFVGTGKSTRFPEGQPFDIADNDPVTQAKVVDDGVAERVEMVGQTGPPSTARRAVEIADADLRDDPLAHEQDRAIAEALTEDEEQEIAARHDEDAVPSDIEARVKKGVKQHPDSDETGRKTNASGGTSHATRRSNQQRKAEADAAASSKDDGK